MMRTRVNFGAVLIYFAAGFIPLASAVTPISQVASVQLTCRSVALGPHSYPITGGTGSMVFSTPTSQNLFQVDWARSPYVSHEFQPQPNGDYLAEYIRVEKDLVVEYATLTIPIPSTDTDGDGLIDFVELNLATNLELNGSISCFVPSNRTYSVKARFQRAPGSPDGTYRLECAPTSGGGMAFTVEQPYSLLVFSAARSRAYYERTHGQAARWRVELFEADNTNGPADAWSTDAVFSFFTLNYVTLPLTLETRDHGPTPLRFAVSQNFTRTGTQHITNLELQERGFLVPTFRNHRNWVLEIIDPNDVNQNGMPDLLDEELTVTDVKLRQLTPDPLAVDGPAEFRAEVLKGGPGFTFQWYVNGSPVIGATEETFRIDRIALGWTPVAGIFRVGVTGQNPRGPSDSEEIQPQLNYAAVESFGGTIAADSLHWNVPPGAMYTPPSWLYEALVGATPAVLKRDAPARMVLRIRDTFTPLEGGTQTVVWRSDGSSPYLDSGLTLTMRDAGRPPNGEQQIEYTVREPGRGVIAQFLARSGDLVVEDDGEDIRLGNGFATFALIRSTYRRGAKVLVMPQPSTATVPLFNFRVLRVTVEPQPWLNISNASMLGLSTRGWAGSGDEVMTAGVVVTGGSKRLLVRGGGPKLTEYGVGDALPDPVLSAFTGTTRVGENDNWELAGATAELNSTFDRIGLARFSPGSRDAALLQDFAAGAYTFQLTGKSVSGVGLIELYDDTPGNGARVTGLATRGRIEGEHKIMVAGVNVTGPENCVVLVRVLGETLWRYGVAGSISDPDLRLFDASGKLLAEADSWSKPFSTSVYQAALTRLGLGEHFSHTEGAMLVTLPPGAYTFHAVGRHNSAGVALLEVYEVR